MKHFESNMALYISRYELIFFVPTGIKINKTESHEIFGTDLWSALQNELGNFLLECHF